MVCMWEPEISLQELVRSGDGIQAARPAQEVPLPAELVQHSRNNSRKKKSLIN